MIHIPASSESILVERILEEMVQKTAGRDCWDCYLRESNRVHLAGAPMTVDPSMRHLSADEFISKATREPMTEEERLDQLSNRHGLGRENQS